LSDPNSAISKLVDMYGYFLQGVVHACPYLPGRIGIYNFTDLNQDRIDKLLSSDGNIEKAPKKLRNMAFNGDYRLTLELATDEDPKVVKLVLTYLVYFRNTDLF